VTLRIALSRGGQSSDRDPERADDLCRRIAIPAADGQRASRGEMAEIIGHRLFRVEIAPVSA